MVSFDRPIATTAEVGEERVRAADDSEMVGSGFPGIASRPAPSVGGFILAEQDTVAAPDSEPAHPRGRSRPAGGRWAPERGEPIPGPPRHGEWPGDRKELPALLSDRPEPAARAHEPEADRGSGLRAARRHDDHLDGRGIRHRSTRIPLQRRGARSALDDRPGLRPLGQLHLDSPRRRDLHHSGLGPGGATRQGGAGRARVSPLRHHLARSPGLRAARRHGHVASPGRPVQHPALRNRSGPGILWRHPGKLAPEHAEPPLLADAEHERLPGWDAPVDDLRDPGDRDDGLDDVIVPA